MQKNEGPASSSQIIQPLVVALVLNYCSYDDTVVCVAALREQGYRPFEIVVIDNASADGSGMRLQNALGHIGVKLIQNSQNLGYAGGNNVGIRYALSIGAEYVFIVNPDVRVEPDCLSLLVERLQSEQAAAAMPLMLSSIVNREVDYRVEQGLLSTVEVDVSSSKAEKIWLSLPTLFGAALLLSCEALRRVGGFDPTYFCYSEEEDLCRRLRFHGYKIGMVPNAVALHRRTYELEGEDAKRARFREYLRLRNRLLYRLKDPNESLLNNWVKVSRGFIGLVLDALSKAKIRDVGQAIQIVIWLLANAKKIINRRHRELRKWICEDFPSP